MNHFWRDIPGFFTWPEYYAWIANKAGETTQDAERMVFRRWHGVEVGVYTGQSAAYLAVAIGPNPRVRLDLVDIELTKHRARENLAPLADNGICVNFIEADSVAASRLYNDASLDFVFIDAEHDYANVRRDIEAWIPKVKSGGIIAGHDHCPDFTGVIQAVTEIFPTYEVWRGERGPGWGDKRMQDTGQYYAVWSVRV